MRPIFIAIILILALLLIVILIKPRLLTIFSVVAMSTMSVVISNITLFGSNRIEDHGDPVSFPLYVVVVFLAMLKVILFQWKKDRIKEIDS